MPPPSFAAPATPSSPAIRISPPSPTISSPPSTFSEAMPTPIGTSDASRESSPAAAPTPISSSSSAVATAPVRNRRSFEHADDEDFDDDFFDDEDEDGVNEKDVDKEARRLRQSLDALDSDDDPANMASWAGQPGIRGRSEALQMVLLTFVTVGVTFTWGIEMTYCTPYLLNLGLTKSNTSLVWIAGPLSGLMVQPFVGVIADESKSRWGRRRPFMVGGATIVVFSLLLLGFTRAIVGLIVSDDDAARTPTIVLAVFAIYAVDFGINAIMSCARSLIVDTLPIEKQQTGAAWASRMSAIGHMLGYGAGAIDLVKIFGTALGNTQFQQLTVIACFAIIISTALTCWGVTERVLITAKVGKHKGRFKIFRQIASTLLNLPPRIQAICWAQFWSWIGWFPFLFYSTTWVGETYFRFDVPDEAKDTKDALGQIGRIGSTSLVIYSTITFAGAWLLPLLVKSPDDHQYASRRPPRAIAGFLDRFSKKKPDLLTTWICGHLLFAASMSLAPFARSYRFATALVCLCGIPWTIAMWAPTAFLGVEVNRLSGAANLPSGRHGAGYRRFSTEELELTVRSSEEDSSVPLHLEHGPESRPSTDSTGELSGIYFGILNIYTTLPQFVGTFIATIVFAILDPGKSPELGHDEPKTPANTSGPNAISICLFIGAMSTLVAALATRKLKFL